MRGNCNCGAVEFAIDGDLEDVYICHCSICRRATGSSGIAVAIAEKSRFRWLAGETQITSWRKPTGDWEMWFCKNCGSPLPGDNDESRMFIPVGLISEGGDKLTVKHHIYVDSKATWDEIGDGGKQHLDAFQTED